MLPIKLGIKNGHLKLAGQQVTIVNRVTNINQLEAGAWKIVNHYADISPVMLDALSRLYPT